MAGTKLPFGPFLIGYQAPTVAEAVDLIVSYRNAGYTKMGNGFLPEDVFTFSGPKATSAKGKKLVEKLKAVGVTKMGGVPIEQAVMYED
jgi:hypothetical protein